MSLHKSFCILRRFLHTKPKRHKKFEWILPNGMKTPISVYNPITKCKTPLILRHDNVVTWYMCGPTLYDSAHIGHACSYVRFDILRRILSEFYNINVVVIMGLTDIDDKIINRSKESGQNWKKLTKHYEEEFFRDMAALNVSKPFMSCRVSDYVPQIIDFVKTIIHKNNAYVGNDGSVYFDTANYDNYGKLSLPEEDETSPHENKRSSLDFALWKASKPDEPWWESPWGKGRPGWHIECSAMASAIFGRNIDIHSGGIDLAFPHHENEEAQSCCYHNVEQWINYWIHSGHLHLKGDTKMSKSLFNTISIENLLKSYTANHFRLFCLLTHYRNGIEFSEEKMNKAVAIHKKINSFVNNCNEYVAGNLNGAIDEPLLFDALNKTQIGVSEALADDFHTPKAMDAIVKLISLCNKMFQESKEKLIQNEATSSPTAVAAVANYVTSVTSLFGISTQSKLSEKNEQSLSQVMDAFVQFRNEVRSRVLQKETKDVELLKICDKARSNLLDCGIELKDRKGLTTWNLIEK